MESSKSLVILSLSIPTFEDRLLQWAIKMLLESVYEQYFLDCSCGFRPHRSVDQALLEIWSAPDD